MLEIGKFSVMNLENAVRGMRNPMSSHRLADSFFENGEFILGEKDLALAKKLCRAGSDHRKFLRQIFVSVDVTAPLYWWKEYDTYKVSTVANSASTMHKIHAKPFELSDFSADMLTAESMEYFKTTIAYLESVRVRYTETKDRALWYDLIQLLPSSYNQLRTCTLNYETLINIYASRKSHKLHEWHVFCDWISSLPYSADLIKLKKD